MDLLRAIARHAAAHPDRPAIVRQRPDGGVFDTVSRAGFAGLVGYFARILHPLPPAPVALTLWHRRDALALAAMVGVLAAGGGFAFLNQKLQPPQWGPLLGRLGATRILTDRTGLRSLAAGTEHWTPAPGSAILLPIRPGEAPPSVPCPLQTLDPLPEPPAAPLPCPPDAPACCLFTSGSTGPPKGVLVSRKDLDRRVAGEVALLGLGPDDRLLALLAWSADVGLNQALAALAAGATLVILDLALPADILTTAARQGITGIHAIPTIWQGLLGAGLAFDTAGRHQSLRFLTLSAGDLPPVQRDALPHLAPGVGIFKTYGQTETFRSSALRPEEFSGHAASVGRPLPGVNITIVDDAGRPLPPGHSGQIIHRGAGTMLGYLDQDRPPPDQVATGDWGHLDPEGYLHIAGRRDAMLKVAGHRFYPREIDAQVMTLPAVAVAQTVGLAPAGGGDRLPVTCVEALAGQILDGPTLERALRRRLPSHMLPVRLIPLAALPRTANGKPDLVALERLARIALGEDGA
ncbi:MAG: AMP-binding protein [Magnetococcales bacterium]|nr:AMP-binding protein [Magnetococcales bacterium]